MPHWVNKGINGMLVCMFCGSLVVQIGQKWICTDVCCRQHDDIPVERSQGFGGWGNSEQVTSTASGLYMVAPNGTTTTT